MRHAKSSWKDLSISDHARPLNKRGKRDAPQMGQWLRSQGLVPDLIASSTAKRARKTATAVASELAGSHDVLLRDDFYHAYPDTYVEFLNTLDVSADVIMLIGHNPGLEELVAQFSGQYERMTTAAVAWIQLPIDAWSEVDFQLRGELKAVWRPRELF